MNHPFQSGEPVSGRDHLRVLVKLDSPCQNWRFNLHFFAIASLPAGSEMAITSRCSDVSGAPRNSCHDGVST